MTSHASQEAWLVRADPSPVDPTGSIVLVCELRQDERATVRSLHPAVDAAIDHAAADTSRPHRSGVGDDADRFVPTQVTTVDTRRDPATLAGAPATHDSPPRGPGAGTSGP